MFAFLKRLFGTPERVRPPRRTTGRSDWERLNREIFARVVDGGRFCIGIVSSGETPSGELTYRMHQGFPGKEASDYIRMRFQPAHFNAVMSSRAGLAHIAKYRLFKVVSDQLCLPVNTMLCPISSNANPKLRSLLIFGGEFIDHQMTTRLEALDGLLNRPEHRAEDRPSGLGGKTRGELMAMLDDLNVKRLFDYNLDELAEIANGLDETKAQLSKRMKPKFWAVNQYVMTKRLK